MHTKGICVSVGSVVATMLLVLAMLFGVQPAYADDEPDTANLSWAITTDPRTGQLASAKVDFPEGASFRDYEVRVVKDGSVVLQKEQTRAPYDATEEIQEAGPGVVVDKSLVQGLVNGNELQALVHRS